MMAVYKPPCACGHPHSLHDTGWDAAGCMHRACSCRSYVEANPAVQKVATAKELLEQIEDEASLEILQILASRVEKVLAECDDVEQMEKGHGVEHPFIFIERLRLILNGEEP